MACWTQAKSTSRSWIVVLLVYLGLKLTLAFLIFQQPSNAFLPDSYGYEDLAVNLVQRGSFDVPGEPAVGVIRTPGYPVFVAVIYALAGRVPGWVILVQLILDALTALLVWQIGKQIVSDAVGLLAAFLYAASLNAFGGSLYLLSDTLFTFVLVCALFFLSRYWRNPRDRWLVIIGALLGLATLVRPIGLYLAMIWIVFLALGQRKSIERRGYQGILLMILVFSGLVTPWMLRNYALTGRFMLSGTEAMNLYCCFAPAALAEDERISLDEARQRVDAPFRYNLNKVEPGELFRAADYAAQIVLQHPNGYAKAYLKGVLATLFEPTYKQWLQLLGVNYSASGFLSKLSILDFRGAITSLSENTSAGFLLAIPLLNGVYTIGVYFLAISGTYIVFKHSRTDNVSALGLICVITILYLVVAPGTGGGLRFRMPAEPLLALLAAVGLARLNSNPAPIIASRTNNSTPRKERITI